MVLCESIQSLSNSMTEVQVVTLADRITVDPEQCGGRPCVRGMRIRVSDVLDLLANGLSPEQVAEELPDLEPADVQACLRFASQAPIDKISSLIAGPVYRAFPRQRYQARR